MEKITKKDTPDSQEYWANKLKNPTFQKYYGEYGELFKKEKAL